MFQFSLPTWRIQYKPQEETDKGGFLNMGSGLSSLNWSGRLILQARSANGVISNSISHVSTSWLSRLYPEVSPHVQRLEQGTPLSWCDIRKPSTSCPCLCLPSRIQKKRWLKRKGWRHKSVWHLLICQVITMQSRLHSTERRYCLALYIVFKSSYLWKKSGRQLNSKGLWRSELQFFITWDHHLLNSGRGEISDSSTENWGIFPFWYK